MYDKTVDEEGKEIRSDAFRNKAPKMPSTNFEILKLPPNTILNLARDEKVTCKVVDNKKVEYKYLTDYNMISMVYDNSRVDITYADDETVIIKGKGEDLSLIIDNMPLDNTNRDRIIKLRKPTGEVYYVINSL